MNKEPEIKSIETEVENSDEDQILKLNVIVEQHSKGNDFHSELKHKNF